MKITPNITKLIPAAKTNLTLFFFNSFFILLRFKYFFNLNFLSYLPSIYNVLIRIL